MKQTHFSPRTALAVIIANMIGTGVFTSLGYQLIDIQTGFPIIMLWFLGGVAALCGAMSYAELGAALPRSGGEYNFLSRIYCPAIGFLGGWVSAIIGFAAPIALAALAFAAYIQTGLAPDAPDWIRRVIAAILVVGLALVHAGRRSASSGLQNVFTLIKILAIIAFCCTALLLAPEAQPVSFAPAAGDGAALTSGAFAVSLIYVSYAYTGWNAATYVSGELENPQRDLPRILILGTLIVTVLYVALNAVFLMVTPIEAMVAKEEVGLIAAQAAFGQNVGTLIGLAFALLLISTVSAMTLAGPRVLQVIGEDIRLFSPLRHSNKDGVPSRAIWFQTGLAVLFVVFLSFDAALVFASFTLALMSFLTVLGLFVFRWRQPEIARPYRVNLFPLPPLIYLGLTGWTLVYVALDKPFEAVLGMGVIVFGWAVYAFLKWRSQATPTAE